MSIDAYTTAGQNLQFPAPISSPRSPTTSDKISGSGSPYLVGQLWINTTGNLQWVYTGGVTWVLTGSGAAGSINSITGDSGGAEVPDAGGNFSILGTAAQVAVTGGTNKETISLIGPYAPATYTAHGVLVGEGASAITALAVGTTGQVLIGATGADPAFGALGVNSGLTAHGVLIGEGNSAIVAATVGTNGQVLIGATGADPAFGTLTTSTGLTFTTGANTLALDVSTDGYKVNAASTGVPIVVQNVYTVTQAAKASFALPTTAAVGTTFKIASASTNTSGWIITQAAGQEIWAKTSHTTSGATGTLAGAVSTAVEIMCVVANTEFIVMNTTDLTGLTFV